MKILFIAPPFPNRVREYLILPSIETCIVSAILKNAGHEVRLCDMKIEHIENKELLQEIKSFAPDIICLDDEPKTHCSSKKIISLIRSNYNEVKIGIRGEIATFIPESVLERNSGLDFIIRSTDDYSLLKLINSNFEDQYMKLIPNIAFRSKTGEIIVNELMNLNYELDCLPMPDRHLYNIEKYIKRDEETIVKSSRGCPGNCLFCIKTKFEKFALFSIKRFCDEIEELLNMGFKSFFFADDTFAFSDQRLEEFYTEVKKRHLKFKWTSNIRIRDINEFKIQKMKEIGAYRVFVGIETINAHTQKIINKNLNISLIKEKLALLKKYDMEFHASFILGNPGDTEEDLSATIKFVQEAKPTLVTFNLIKIYPGLDMYNNPDKYDLIMEDPYWYEKDEWSYKVVMGTKKLPPDALERWSRKCLWEFIKE